MIRHGASLLRAFAGARVPKLTVVLRKAYGGAVITMNSKRPRRRPRLRLAAAPRSGSWPRARRSASSTGASSRPAATATPDELADDVRGGAPERRSRPPPAGFVDEVIEPAETRDRLAWALEALERDDAARPSRRSRPTSSRPAAHAQRLSLYVALGDSFTAGAGERRRGAGLARAARRAAAGSSTRLLMLAQPRRRRALPAARCSSSYRRRSSSSPTWSRSSAAPTTSCARPGPTPSATPRTWRRSWAGCGWRTPACGSSPRPRPSSWDFIAHGPADAAPDRARVSPPSTASLAGSPAPTRRPLPGGRRTSRALADPENFGDDGLHPSAARAPARGRGLRGPAARRATESRRANQEESDERERRRDDGGWRSTLPGVGDELTTAGGRSPRPTWSRSRR